MKKLLFVLLFLGALVNVKAQFNQSVCVNYLDMSSLNYDMEVCIIFSSLCNCPDDLPVEAMDCVTLSVGGSHCFQIPTFPCSSGGGIEGDGSSGGEVLGCVSEVIINPPVGESIRFTYAIGAYGVGSLQDSDVYVYQVNPDGSISLYTSIVTGM